jgi:endonuclease/exonuclease/phosphatase family metal-dependent hydrolase
MPKVRVSTFNCENLFSRPKVLNFDDKANANEPLKKLAKLDGILAKPQYTDKDKNSILELLNQLKEFVDLNQMKNKLVGTKAGKTVVKVNGRSAWVGGITLKRDTIPTEAQRSTAEVLKAVNADIQCMVEVEDRITLERFSQTFFKGPKAYPFNLLIDGNDRRGIDVGLLSRFPLAPAKTHVFDRSSTKRSRIFSRDCLEVGITLPDGTPIFVLINHFKSQAGGTKASNDARRKAQADRVAEILGEYNLKKELVVVAGDLNDKPPNAPLAGLLGLPNLVDVLARQFSNPKERWTYRDKSQIDYLLVSKPLAEAMTEARVERRGLFQADKLTKDLPGGPVKPFPMVTDDTNDASDHAAVWAEFSL